MCPAKFYSTLCYNQTEAQGAQRKHENIYQFWGLLKLGCFWKEKAFRFVFMISQLFWQILLRHENHILKHDFILIHSRIFCCWKKFFDFSTHLSVGKNFCQLLWQNKAFFLNLTFLAIQVQVNKLKFNFLDLKRNITISHTSSISHFP